METNLVDRMSARMRRHARALMVSLVGSVLAAVALVVSGWLLGNGRTVTYGIPIVLLAIPIVGVVSALVNLRCPACGRRVRRQVALRFTPFPGEHATACPHCGREIFARQR